MAPAPVKIWRDPTRSDVEELLESRGGSLNVRNWGTHREYWAFLPDRPENEAAFTLLARVSKGVRPDWRGMLQMLGSDWA